MNKKLYKFRVFVAMICGTLAILDILAYSDTMPSLVIILSLLFLAFLCFLLKLVKLLTSD